MKFRDANMGDALRLYFWRNDAHTRAMSTNTAWVDWADHLDWLQGRLLQRGDLWIAEHDGSPVGMVRADGPVLSWTVAPRFRGSGLGSQMLLAFCEMFPGPWEAFIKASNVRSLAMAHKAGVRVTLDPLRE